MTLLVAPLTFAMDAPHGADCLQCHMDHELFGDQIGDVSGNANNCQSCHQPGEVAGAKALLEINQASPAPGQPANVSPHGTSHRWDSHPAGRVVGLGDTPEGSLKAAGVYAGRYAKTYTVTIVTDGDAGSALFSWSATSPDGGSGSNLPSGSAVPLQNGLVLSFLNARSDSPAFRVGDRWHVLVRPDLSPPTNPNLAPYTDEGTVVCSTCHDQHFQFNEPFDPAAPPYTTHEGSAGRHFMRMNNESDQMCAECHGARFVTDSLAGSHPVGIPVPVNAWLHQPPSLPLGKTDGDMSCSTCHQLHGSASDDGNLLRLADGITLCTQCHALADTATPASHLNPLTASLWPGGQYGSLFPAVTDASQRGGCGACHRVHGWPDGSNPTGDYPTLLVEREENLCYTCHDGSPAAKNIRANFARTYKHPVSLAGRHTADEDGISANYGTSNRHAECADCHNVHRLASDPGSVAAPYASAALRGVGRVSVINVNTSVINYTFRSPADPAPVKEYEVCFKCHSGWTSQPSGQSNLALDFNDKNPSFHPVEARAKDLGINPASFVNGWGPGRLVTCTDCHTSDDTSIRGPHGSSYQWLLKKPYANSRSPALPSNGLCFDCHSPSVYNTSGSSLSRWRGRDRPGHTHGGYNCYACHESHGSSSKPFLIGNNLQTYTRTATGGTCNPTCHGNESYTVAYPR